MPDVSALIASYGLPVAILFAATLIRATFGFGDALVAMPLLALIMPLEIAAPLVAVVSAVIAAFVLGSDWRYASLGAVVGLLCGAVPGIVAGLLLLDSNLPLPWMKGLLAGVVLAFSLWSLASPRTVMLRTDRLAAPCGLLAGVFSGAFNTPGPFLVMYGSLRGWSAREFRSTLQAWFLPTSLLVCAGHAMEGRLTQSPVPGLLAAAALPVLCATMLGTALSRRIDPRKYRLIVCLLLLVVGLVLLADACGV